MTCKNHLVDISLPDLIDKISILKIKEWILSKDCSEMIKNLEHDIDMVIKEKDIKCSAELIRKISMMTICNLMVWFLKDTMQKTTDHKQYISYLKEAQDLNNCIKNSVKNMILEEIGDLTVYNKKTTFIEHRKGEWFSPIIEDHDDKKL